MSKVVEVNLLPAANPEVTHLGQMQSSALWFQWKMKGKAGNIQSKP